MRKRILIIGATVLLSTTLLSSAEIALQRIEAVLMDLKEDITLAQVGIIDVMVYTAYKSHLTQVRIRLERYINSRIQSDQLVTDKFDYIPP